MIENIIHKLNKSGLDAHTSDIGLRIFGHSSSKNNNRSFIISPNTNAKDWIALVEALNGNNTIIRISNTIDLASDAIINFFDISKQQKDEEEFLSAIIELQRNYLCSEIMEENKITISETDLSISSNPWWTSYDFMLRTPHSQKRIIADLIWHGKSWTLVDKVNEKFHEFETLEQSIDTTLSIR